MHGMHFTNSHTLTYNDDHDTHAKTETKKRSAGDQSLVSPHVLQIRRSTQARLSTLLKLASLALTLTLTRASAASPHSKTTQWLSPYTHLFVPPPLTRLFLPLVHSLTHSLTLSSAHWATYFLLCRVSSQ